MARKQAKTVEEVERLASLRQAMISPYIAQGYEVKVDFPEERRIIITRQKKFRTVWFVIGLIFYLIPGLLYWLYWYLTKDEDKTLLY